MATRRTLKTLNLRLVCSELVQFTRYAAFGAVATRVLLVTGHDQTIPWRER